MKSSAVRQDRRALHTRVVYSIDDAQQSVTVLSIAHRRESYRGL